ncbi:uncharacterized protein LOC118184877 [Stegodyphus dumicola]|uniref:uncharacterized protein LOC118184877 n=1 Tax=Stegodyphus dumicola TaxID=202533 RepID=UPI0015AA8833|nr:uncharacterized protein LOC118184877 [Stegodyphus dumicola]
MANCMNENDCGKTLVSLSFILTTSLVLFLVEGYEIESCNLIECPHRTRSFAYYESGDGTFRLCRKLRKIVPCADNCLRTFFPDFFPESHVSHGFLKELCDGPLISQLDIHWDCIKKHFYRLLTCISVSGSMTANARAESDYTKIISCKKVFSILNCPQLVMENSCEEEAIEVLRNILRLLLHNSMSSCVSVSLQDTAVPVSYRLGKTFIKIASCMDNNQEVVGNCLEGHIQTTYHLEKYAFGEDLRVDSCIQSSLSHECSVQKPMGGIFPSLFLYGKNIKNISQDNKYSLNDLFSSHVMTNQSGVAVKGLAESDNSNGMTESQSISFMEGLHDGDMSLPTRTTPFLHETEKPIPTTVNGSVSSKVPHSYKVFTYSKVLLKTTLVTTLRKASFFLNTVSNDTHSDAVNMLNASYKSDLNEIKGKKFNNFQYTAQETNHYISGANLRFSHICILIVIETILRNLYNL